MTSFGLKIIAVIAMTIDHAAKILGQSGLMVLFPNMSLSTSYLIMEIMQGIGRIAFPLFAFMIAEGAAKTRSMFKYIGRLALFAVLSEPIFYYAFSVLEPSVAGFFSNLVGFNFTNVFVTLTLGAATIYIYQRLKCRKHQKVWMLFTPILVLVLLIAEGISCDYGMMGVILIVALFLANRKSHKTIVLLVWSMVLYVFGQAGFGLYWQQVSIYNIVECVCAASAGVLIWLYNGKRGKQMKWSFYIYYPAHLALLACISACLQ